MSNLKNKHDDDFSISPPPSIPSEPSTPSTISSLSSFPSEPSTPSTFNIDKFFEELNEMGSSENINSTKLFLDNLNLITLLNKQVSDQIPFNIKKYAFKKVFDENKNLFSQNAWAQLKNLISTEIVKQRQKEEEQQRQKEEQMRLSQARMEEEMRLSKARMEEAKKRAEYAAKRKKKVMEIKGFHYREGEENDKFWDRLVIDGGSLNKSKKVRKHKKNKTRSKK